MLDRTTSSVHRAGTYCWIHNIFGSRAKCQLDGLSPGAIGKRQTEDGQKVKLM